MKQHYPGAFRREHVMGRYLGAATLRPLPVKYCVKGHRSRHDLDDPPCWKARRRHSSLFITGWTLGKLRGSGNTCSAGQDAHWTGKLIAHLTKVFLCALPRIKFIPYSSWLYIFSPRSILTLSSDLRHGGVRIFPSVQWQRYGLYDKGNGESEGLWQWCVTLDFWTLLIVWNSK
jgi:hypothetical protein